MAGREFRLDQDLHSSASSDCSGEIRADQPAWSPDGSRIAFLASPQSITLDGFARADAPWNLYLVGSNEQHPVMALGGLIHPQDLAWSPDGRWLAFAVEMAGRGEGIWLYGVSSHHLLRVASGMFLGVSWSPDGSQIAVLHDLGSGGAQVFNTEVRLLDVRTALSSTP